MMQGRTIRWDRIIGVFLPPLIIILLLCVACEKAKEKQTEEETEIITADNPVTETEAMTTEPADTDFIVVIDPGHGGWDVGATNASETRFEKDDVLRLGLAVQTAFLQTYPDVQIVMTRDTDEYVSLEDRCDIANSIDADFFISLHRNASEEGEGAEIWIYSDISGTDTTAEMLADYIMNALVDVGISRNRGIMKGYREDEEADDTGSNYYVNKHTYMPSCLVELGFMDSDVDNQNFDNKLEAYAQAIADAVIRVAKQKDLYPSGAQNTISEISETQDISETVEAVN